MRGGLGADPRPNRGTGRYHDERFLKNRPSGDTRRVPLSPHLAALWRESIETFGTTEDGWLFFIRAWTVAEGGARFGEAKD